MEKERKIPQHDDKVPLNFLFEKVRLVAYIWNTDLASSNFLPVPCSVDVLGRRTAPEKEAGVSTAMVVTELSPSDHRNNPVPLTFPLLCSPYTLKTQTKQVRDLC